MRVASTRQKDLHGAAVNLALEKSMQDVQTLLRWVLETEEPKEAIRHVRRAKELLDEMEGNLSRL